MAANQGGRNVCSDEPIIESESADATMLIGQVRNKPRESRKSLELPTGRVKDLESLLNTLSEKSVRRLG